MRPCRPLSQLGRCRMGPRGGTFDALVSEHLRARSEPQNPLNMIDTNRIPVANSTKRYKDFPPGWRHIKVPMSSRRAAIAGLGLYCPSRPKALWAQRAARAWVAIFGPRALPGWSLPWIPLSEREWPDLSDTLRRELGEFDEVAGYSRTQASRGGVGLLLLRHGSAIAFVKLRAGDHGQLANELCSLDATWRYRPRAFGVPQPLRFGSMGDWQYLATTPLPPGLHRPPCHPPLRAILEEVEAALTGLPRPPGTPDHWRPMHGDFAPWNLRQVRGGSLFLVDWEAAGWAPPGADAVFYEAARAALGHQFADRCHAPEAVQFWRERVLAHHPENARDHRLAKALDEVLGRMAGSTWERRECK